jgi:hypothetical protein
MFRPCGEMMPNPDPRVRTGGAGRGGGCWAAASGDWNVAEGNYAVETGSGLAAYQLLTSRVLGNFSGPYYILFCGFGQGADADCHLFSTGETRRMGTVASSRSYHWPMRDNLGSLNWKASNISL